MENAEWTGEVWVVLVDGMIANNACTSLCYAEKLRDEYMIRCPKMMVVIERLDVFKEVFCE